MTKAELLETMAGLHACDQATAWVKKSKARSAEAIWESCPNASWMLWLYERAKPDHKTAVRVACAIARTALKHVPAGEKRPERCIEVTEMWLEDRATLDEVRAARNACLDYRSAADAADAAAYAADAAAYAAAAYAADAYAAAAAAYAAAYAAAAARAKSQKASADIVRKYITWADVEAGL